MQKLTATAVKKTNPSTKPKKLSDGGGLYLLIQPNGSRYWRYDYRFAGKRKTLAIGVHPEMTLKEAREILRQEIDPSKIKKIGKLTKHITAANSFESIGLEWFFTKVEDKSEGHKKRTKRMLEKDLFPTLGNHPIGNITALELLCTLRKIESRGAIETTRRTKQVAGKFSAMQLRRDEQNEILPGIWRVC